MMKIKKIIRWAFLFLLPLSMSACTAQTTAQPTPNLDATISAAVSNAQNSLIQTMTAGAPVVTGSEAAATATPTPEPTPTLTTTVETETAASESAEPTALPVQAGVYLTLSKDTNCRQGPTTVYPVVTTLKSGERLMVTGRNATSDSFYVQNPAQAGTYCWVWGGNAAFEGNKGALPVFTPQPTPLSTSTATLEPNFIASYVDTEYCNTDYSFRIYVKNTSDLIWRSIKIYSYDPDTGYEATHVDNFFNQYIGCTLDFGQSDLTKGEFARVVAYNPGHIDYNPKGHRFTVKVTLCTEDGLGGTCETKELRVNP